VPAPPPPRIACLLAPDLPLAAALRAHPELRGRPLAVVSERGPRAEILAVSPEAAQAGVRPQQGLVHARALCAELYVQRASPALERAARDALLDAALSTSPRAVLAPPGSGLLAAEAAVFVDARGVARLFHSERGFAGALCDRAARLGLPTVVSVASARSVARIAARTLIAASPSGETGTTRVLPPGSEADFLSPLPLDLLDPEDRLASDLARFGLQRVGDLLRIPERGLVTRFGRRILPLLALARGEDRSPPPPAPSESLLEEALDLERPIQALEPLLFVLRGALARLRARLVSRRLAAAQLEIELGLSGGGRDARRVAASAPTLEPRIWLRLIGLSLESRPPPAAIERVRLAVEARAPRGDQLDFFRPAGAPPAALDRTLAELTVLCGEGRVGAPALADDPRPDAHALAPFHPQPPCRDNAPAPRASLGMRALRPPLPAQVLAPHGSPEAVRSALGGGGVLHCAGPWRTTGRWWSEDERFAFDHFDVQTEDGLVFRLRWNHVARRWEIDGVYD